jgi:hypothetical protein
VPSFQRGRTALVIAVAASAAAVAGCGSGDDSDSSADEYRQAANAICAETQMQEEAAYGEMIDTLDEIRQAVPIASQEIDELRALSPPADLRAAHEEILALLDEAEGLIKGALAQIDAGRDPATAFGAIETSSRARLRAGKGHPLQTGVF